MEDIKMALFKKKTAKKKVAKKKNQVKEFVDGKEVAPEKIPDLEIPVPTPNEDSVQEEKQQTPEEVFAEGRSVGFQEGLIYAINLTQDHLQQHQEELKKKIAEKEVQP